MERENADFVEEKQRETDIIISPENSKEAEKAKQIGVVDSSTRNLALSIPKNRRRFRAKRRRQLFCGDVIFEAVQFLQLRNLLRVNTANKQISRPAEVSLKRLKSPRIVGPLLINHNGVHRDGGFSSRGQMILERLDFPKGQPPDNILGFGRVTINLRVGSAQLLNKIEKFLQICEKLLRQHDLVFTLNGLGYSVERNAVLEGFASRILSQFAGGFRMVETDLYTLEVAPFTSRGFRSTKRLLFINFMGDRTTPLNNRDFQRCLNWLHFPTTDGAPRTLIFCMNQRYFGSADKIIPMIVERFEQSEDESSGASPKFSLIVFSHVGASPLNLTHFHLMNEETGDALSLEPIDKGRDRFGRPLSELFAMDSGIQSQAADRSSAIEGFLGRALFLDDRTNVTEQISGYILRRDVAVGPWTQSELFEARRHQNSVSNQENVVYFTWH